MSNSKVFYFLLILSTFPLTACMSPYHLIFGSNVESDFHFKDNKYVAAFRVNNTGCYTLNFYSEEGVKSDGIIVEAYYRDNRNVDGGTLIHSMIFYGDQEKIKEKLELKFFCCKSGDVIQFSISGVPEDFFKNKKLKFRRHNSDSVLELDVPIFYIPPTAKPYKELDEASLKRRLQLLEEKEKVSELIRNMNMPNPRNISVTFRGKHLDTSVNGVSLKDYIQSAIKKMSKNKQL